MLHLFCFDKCRLHKKVLLILGPTPEGMKKLCERVFCFNGLQPPISGSSAEKPTVASRVIGLDVERHLQLAIHFCIHRKLCRKTLQVGKREGAPHFVIAVWRANAAEKPRSA